MKQPLSLNDQVTLMKRFMVRSMHYNETNELDLMQEADRAASAPDEESEAKGNATN